MRSIDEIEGWRKTLIQQAQAAPTHPLSQQMAALALAMSDWMADATEAGTTYGILLPPNDCPRLWDSKGRAWIRSDDPLRSDWPGGKWQLEHKKDQAPDHSGPWAGEAVGWVIALQYHGPFTDQAKPCGHAFTLRDPVGAILAMYPCIREEGHPGAHELPVSCWKTEQEARSVQR